MKAAFAGVISRSIGGCGAVAPVRASLRTWLALSYRPGRRACSSVNAASSTLGCGWEQPHSADISATVEIAMAGLRIEVTPLGSIATTKGHDALEQHRVADACGARGFGEVLLAGQVRVGVGLEHENAAVLAQAEIDASIPREMQRAINAP